MNQNIVRLTQMEIHHIKNVNNGHLEFSSGRKGSILGVYGQNGSGKTVVVDCMMLLKNLLCGRRIQQNFYHYINSQSDTAEVKYCFDIKTADEIYYVEYEISLLKKSEDNFCVSGEKLSMKEIVEGKRTRLTSLFEYQKGVKELFRPQKHYNYFEKNMEYMMALGIAHQSVENYNEEKRRPEVGSFLFSKKAQEVFAKATGEPEKIYFISSILQFFGMNNLAVIENSHYGLLALNLEALPINIDWLNSLKPKVSGIILHLTDINVIDKEVYPYVVSTIQQINIVLRSLIPDIQLEICNAFDKLMKNGKDGVQFEIITIRGESKIPLLYESAGIKKLISICSNLVACYNKEGYCLVVDELDSGIYEYLLGECLEVLQDKAKGQLIFTSHNLRPLEVLDNDFLIYTTVNPDNRYIKSSYIKNTQNTRLSYLRSVKLGGQKEQLYNETNVYEMALAMRRAGKVGLNDRKK